MHFTISAPACAFFPNALLLYLLLIAPLSVHSVPVAGTWKDLAPLPAVRQEHAVVALDQHIYVLGGITNLDGTIVTIASLERYSPLTNTWESDLAPLPMPMNHVNLAAVSGKLYALGGLTGGDEWKATDRCFVYDPPADHWTELPPMPAGTARGASAMGVHQGVVYLAGGMKVLVIGGLQDTVATVSAYDTATRQWTSLPPLPEGRDHAGGAIIDGVLYVVGGRNRGRENIKDTVYAMDLKGPTKGWVEKARMPTARGGFPAAVVDDIIYTFGGDGADGVVPPIEAYDTRNDCWTDLGLWKVPRHGVGGASLDGAIYISGGGSKSGPTPTDHNDAYVVRGG